MLTGLKKLAIVALLVAISPLGHADTYTQTRYPFAMVHGWMGWSNLAGVLNYWYGITDEMRAGGATVYVANVSSSNSTEIRGEQFIKQLDNWRAMYGHTKFNLIGHSHGGPTSRYVASVRPDLVASVTTIASPTSGIAIADYLTKNSSQPQSILATTFLSLLGRTQNVLQGSVGYPIDPSAAINSLNTAGASAFAQRHPQGLPSTPCGQGAPTVNSINYYSISGTSVITNILDPFDAVAITLGSLLNGFQHDGLIERCQSHLGVVVRDNYPWNHFDEINQLMGLRGLFSPDPKAFYRSHANRLKNAGL